MPVTTTPLPITCPSWCRTDHETEAADWADKQEAMARYMRAPENQAEMRYAFGADFTPRAEDAPDLPALDVPLHEQEVGRVHVCGRSGTSAAVRVVIQAVADDDEPARISVFTDPDGAYAEDAYTAQEARSLAALLVVGRAGA